MDRAFRYESLKESDVKLGELLEERLTLFGTAVESATIEVTLVEATRFPTVKKPPRGSN